MALGLSLATPLSYSRCNKLKAEIATSLGDYYGLTTERTFTDEESVGRYINSDIDYASYTDPSEVIQRRQFLALFQKDASLASVLGTDLEGVAFSKWLEAEQMCRETNVKFGISGCPPSDLITDAEARLIKRVRDKIEVILGPAPKFADLQFGFGPGASIGVSKNTSVRRKFHAQVTVATNAFPYLKQVGKEFPHWDLQNAIPVRGKLTFVPKNAKTKRSIVVEPILNTFVQKGIGMAIRHRLKRSGIDLNSQQTNQDLARLGSFTGIISTVDLSSASDTIAKSVVMELLPPDWYTLVDMWRTPSVSYKDKVYRLEKFSSMGNGFTFELETLIFFAITSVVTGRSGFVSVFGDDIIVPSRKYDELVGALSTFGFSVNEAKSFKDGPFRESCGKDFFVGIDVRPWYVRRKLRYSDLFVAHNFFKRRGNDDIASLILHYIPVRLRVFGPDGYGDGHLLGDWQPIHHKSKKRGWAGVHFKTWVTIPRTCKDDSPSDYVAWLYLCTGGSIDNLRKQTYQVSLAQDGYHRPAILSRDSPDMRNHVRSIALEFADDLGETLEASTSMYHERGSAKYRLGMVHTYTLPC